MTTYSTIPDDRGASPRHCARDMSRSRRRGGKDGGHGGQASIISSNINLLNTIVGAGTLAMPSVLSHTGILLGVLLILWSGVTAAFGLVLQSRCAHYLDRRGSSFALSQITYAGASVIFDLAIAVSYMIIIGELMPDVMRAFHPSPPQQLDAADVEAISYLVDRHFWITAFMLLIIPLSFLRRLDSLKYTSIVALVSISYLIVLVVYHFAADPHVGAKEIRVFSWAGPVATLSTLPVAVFAYTCHQNMFSVINEINDNSPAAIVGVVATSIGSATFIYILVAITGYLTFGNAVVGNIISMYPNGVASTVSKAAIVIVLFSIPLQVHPCRASLDAVLRWRPNRAGSASSRRSASPNLFTPRGEPHASTASPAPISDARFALLTTAILTLAYFTALSVSSLDRVLAFVGSTGSTSISFILPGLFYYKISDPEGVHQQRLLKTDDDMDDDDDAAANGPADEELIHSAGGNDGGVLSMAEEPVHAASILGRWWRPRRRWRWDLEHLDHGLVRKLALSLAVYGMVIMAVCLIMNVFFAVAH